MRPPFSLLLDSLPGMAYRCRGLPDGRLEYVTEGCRTLTGYTSDELIDARRIDYRDTLHPDDRPAAERAVSEACAARQPFDLRYRIRTASGAERWVWERGCGVYAEDGTLTAIEGLILDTTAQVRAEDGLAESEARYRRLLGSVTDYICTVRVQDGRVVDTAHGPGCVAVTGYTSEDYASDPYLWYRMVHEEDRSWVQEHAARAVAGDTTAHEHRIHHRDGSVRWVRNTPVPRRDEQGAVVAYDALIADITPRKQAEVALRENERFLSNVFASIQDGISVLDRDFRIVRVNTAMERWHAHALPLVGRLCYEVYHGRQTRCEFCPSARCLESGNAEHEVMPWVDPEGKPLGWLDLFSFPLTDPVTGQVRGVIEYVRDISEARRAAEALREKEEQLRQAHKMEAVGTLAGGVAHDFNNLLTAILGYADLLRRETPEGSGARQRVEEILRAGNRAAGLTRKLLAFSRKQVLSPRALDLNAVLIDMGDMLRRLIAEDIELVILPAQGLASVRADPQQIEQVVLNLVVNARDAMPHGGRVLIETRRVNLDAEYTARHLGVRPGPYVLLAVSDTGCGMDAATRSHLFEPFFTTKEPGRGTGLGLATIYGIAKQSGGNVWIYSEVAQGTTVKVYLPQALDAGRPTEVASAPAAIRAGSETVLVVEDEPSIRALASDILRGCGYSVLTAANGREAHALLRDRPEPIDLLLTDVVMPQMSGHELGGLARAARPGIAIVYMSGYTDEAVVVQGLLGRETAFLQKPFTAEQLTRKVREALEARPDVAERTAPRS